MADDANSIFAFTASSGRPADGNVVPFPNTKRPTKSEAERKACKRERKHQVKKLRPTTFWASNEHPVFGDDMKWRWIAAGCAVCRLCPSFMARYGFGLHP